MFGRGGFGRGGAGGNHGADGMGRGQGAGLGGGLGRGRGGPGGGSDFSSPPQKLIGAAVKGIASGIGLMAERTKRKKDNASAVVDSDDVHAGSEIVLAEERPGEVLAMEWALDDAQDSISSDHRPNSEHRTDEQVVDSFLEAHIALPAHIDPTNLHKLQCPILLPQRRPKDRTRGFIRAYAPALEACGIDQTEWLAFLDTFEKSSQASSWIMALNLATFATMALPSLTAFAVSAAVQAATVVAAEAQTRYRTNQFLDRINEDYFRPRGLFCLVLTWNPESEDVHQACDLTRHVARAVDTKSKFRGSSGQTYGEGNLLEVAPLVFPELDRLHDEGSAQAAGKREKLKREKAFVDDYFDRRATAKYAAKHPDSALATSVPTAEFSSRYADPNHPASSGDLIALITGGHLTNPGLGGAVSGLASQRRGGTGSEAATTSTQAMGLGGVGMGHKAMNPKRLLGKNVLYLMVVNMPSEQELAAARLNL